jgi:hypothetical protein
MHQQPELVHLDTVPGGVDCARHVFEHYSPLQRGRQGRRGRRLLRRSVIWDLLHEEVGLGPELGAAQRLRDRLRWLVFIALFLFLFLFVFVFANFCIKKARMIFSR